MQTTFDGCRSDQIIHNLINIQNFLHTPLKIPNANLKSGRFIYYFKSPQPSIEMHARIMNILFKTMETRSVAWSEREKAVHQTKK